MDTAENRGAAWLYVQYGCGTDCPSGWKNFDASPTLVLQRIPALGTLFRRGSFPVFPREVRYGNIVNGLPIPANSCRGLFCSHVLEHLALENARAALRNSFSYLMPGGVFRLIVPDLEAIARQYVASEDPSAAVLFIGQTGMGKKTRARTLPAFTREWLGNSTHLWMWDFRALAAELEKAGFRRIRRVAPGDFGDPRFREVEKEDRWHNSLGIECSKD